MVLPRTQAGFSPEQVTAEQEETRQRPIPVIGKWPDLQKMVNVRGGWDKITVEDWERFDAAFKQASKDHRVRASF